jgi:hypothetical protein
MRLTKEYCHWSALSWSLMRRYLGPTWSNLVILRPNVMKKSIFKSLIWELFYKSLVSTTSTKKCSSRNSPVVKLFL